MLKTRVFVNCHVLYKVYHISMFCLLCAKLLFICVFFVLIRKLLFLLRQIRFFSYNGVVGLNEVLVVILVAFSLNGNL